MAEKCPICERAAANVLAVEQDDILSEEESLFDFLTEYDQRCTFIVKNAEGEDVAMIFFHRTKE